MNAHHFRIDWSAYSPSRDEPRPQRDNPPAEKERVTGESGTPRNQNA